MQEKTRKVIGLLFTFVFCFSLVISISTNLEVNASELSQDIIQQGTQYTKREVLKKDYQKIYDKVYSNIGLLEEDYAAGTVLFDFSDEDVHFNESNGDTIYIALGSLLDDHPELEWVAPASLEAVTDAESEKLMGIRLRNTVINARIQPYQDKTVFDLEMEQMNAQISEIIHNTESLSSKYEKLLYIHDWLVTNNVYNSYVAADESDSADIRAWSAVSAFLSNNDPKNGPVCEGYSEAFKILCDRLNIPCVLLTGMQHQWNAVELDGKWYAVDCTWDDPLSSSSNLDYVRYDYFLVGTETKTLGGTSTYGEDHITYSTENIPQINDKGLAFLNTVVLEDAVYDGSPHGISDEPVAIHGNTEITGEFTFSYYKLSEEGVWESMRSVIPVDAGNYKVRISLVHNEYEASQEFTFQIRQAELSEDDMIVDLSDAIYNGTAITKNITVVYDGQELSEGTDYSVSYHNNVNTGIAEISVTGMGNYTGTKTVDFTIVGAKITTDHISNIVNFEYDGTQKTQVPLVVVNGETLAEGIDYSVAYEGDCRNVGTSYVIVTGKGNYQGECKIAFEISKAALSGTSTDDPTGESSNSQLNPETGDNSWGILMWTAILSMLLIAGCALRKRRCK